MIVGGGLAGLVCAHRLKQAGHRAVVHEASDRLGGRVWTIRGVFADGQIAEHGGELIDSDHVAMRGLVAELGLTLNNVVAAEKPGTGQVFHFNGARYPVTQAIADFQSVYPKLKADLLETGYPTLHNRHKPRGVELDHMSIADWIQQNVPGGLESNLGRLLDVAYNTEFGADIGDQTSLNILYLLGYSGGGRLRLFGASNERFHVQGGNDQVVRRLAQELDGQLRLSSELVEIKRLDGGGYQLNFDGDGGASRVKASQVVLALPFAVMRASVDYSGAGFDPVKTMAIEQQGMGTNSKLNVQFPTAAGTPSTPTGAPTRTTATSRAGRRAAPSPAARASWSTTPADDRKELRRCLRGRARQAVPGTARTGAARRPGRLQRQGRARLLDGPALHPRQLRLLPRRADDGLRRSRGEASGNCHFAGEQTSYTFQGYMEGAVKSGERAASEVVAALGGGS